jgi:hypothetical protein
MTTCTRPLLLGYIRAHLTMTADEIDAARLSLAAFALAEGFALGTVYLEHPQTAPAAFEALVDAVRRGRVRKLALERVDGEPVVGSAYEELLIELGFRAGPRKLTLTA